MPSTGGGPLAVGDLAYNFTLQDLDGNEVNLEALHGRPVVVNFWASWCAPCRVEMPELEAAFQAYQEDDLVILALDQEESPEVVHEFFIEEMGLTFTPVLDSEGSISELYGVNRIFPGEFQVVLQYIGGIVAVSKAEVDVFSLNRRVNALAATAALGDQSLVDVPCLFVLA